MCGKPIELTVDDSDDLGTHTVQAVDSLEGAEQFAQRMAGGAGQWGNHLFCAECYNRFERLNKILDGIDATLKFENCCICEKRTTWPICAECCNRLDTPETSPATSQNCYMCGRPLEPNDERLVDERAPVAVAPLGLIGLDSVKRSLDEIRSQLAINAERKAAGLPAPRLSLHAVFVGNPGTGKTTVARVYAQMLRENGYLTKGHLVEADRSALVASYLGQTAEKTSEVLKKSLGGVLFIDEAYSLKHDEQDWFGQECIDTILKFMEDRRDDLVVILAGYPDRMDALLETNPGFKSRFGERLVFDDFSNDQLKSIFATMANERGYSVAQDDLAAAVDVLARERVGKYFGNARAVRNLLEQAIRRQAARLDAQQRSGAALTRETLALLERSDLLGWVVQVRPSAEDLNRLIGLDAINETVREYEALIKLAKLRGRDPRDVLQPYFVMMGSPGTGKTTVARLMGRIFKEAGYLPSDQVVEVDRGSLVAGYIGQTAIKTGEVL